MGTRSTRREKIQWLSSTIEQVFREDKEAVINVNRILAEFALKNGSSVRVGREIIDMFDQVGTIVIIGNEIRKGK